MALELISLKLTLERLLYSSGTSFVPPSREILEFAYEKLASFEEIAKRMFLKNARFTLAVSNLTDALQMEVLTKIDPRFAICEDGVRGSIDLRDQNHVVHPFFETLKKMEEYPEELLYCLPKEDDGDDDAVSSRLGSGGHKSQMVGLSDLYNELKGRIMDPKKIDIFLALVGMPGIGKTTLAKEVFEDSDIVKHFDCRAWVTLGRKCQLKKVLARRVLAQVNPEGDQMVVEGDEVTAREYLKESLKGKRYLVILDDVWDRYALHYLKRSDLYGGNELENPFPDEGNGSRVLLITRLQQVDGPSISRGDLTMRLLNKVESWDLLDEKVFAEGRCPPQLEKAGKKIAENCDGLPLTIVTVADLLSKEVKNLQYWSEVAAKKNHQVFMAAYDEISKVLLPSYKHLPPFLQMHFLYMGIFPQDYQMPRSKLINMWKVDGFPELNVDKSISPSEMECLEELVSNSLVMTHQSTPRPQWATAGEQIKTCGLHASLWHLSNKEATRTKFSHVLNSFSDRLGEAIKGQCRLSLHNNILLGIKDVHESVEANCASTAHSLLCYGPHHQYQVPVCFGLGLLRVLDALAIRFYEFPLKVLQLVELRYLGITLNGKLPASISQLSNLHFLIVNRHMSIKYCGTTSYLPVEIWDMKELQHLQVAGSDLPNPCGASLKSLKVLSNVSSHTCTKDVLEAVPNLEKLGIHIELAHDDDHAGKPLSCFDYISHLKWLRSLKCVVTNPKVTPLRAPFSIFPPNLRKLTLSGLGYPWKEMGKLALLPRLLVLKLRNYAFRGREWEVKEGFGILHYLVIEDTDLEEWKIGHKSFQRLKCLSIKHCYNLKRVHGEFDGLLSNVQLVDCNPLGVEQMKKATSAGTELSAHSSWDTGSSKEMSHNSFH